MNKKFLPSILCAVVLCVSLIGFAGCGAKSYSYEEFSKAYTDYIAANSITSTSTNGIFDSEGLVRVQYQNELMRDAIAADTVEDYKLMFTRLSADTSSDQAIFEPALKASMLYISKYIDVTPAKTVPTDRSTGLYAKLVNLTDKTNTFRYNLVKFGVRAEDFDKNNAVDKAFLKHLLDSYYDLIIASCELSLDFVDVANKYLYNDTAKNASGRLPAGSIERYYLEELTKMVDTYARFDLVRFYQQAYIVDGAEYYTNKEPAKNVNTMLDAYLLNKAKLVAFENRFNDGDMNASEKAIIKAYDACVAFEDLYSSAYTVASESLSKAGNMTHDLDEEYDPSNNATMHKQIVAAFVKGEVTNKANLLKDIMYQSALLV